MDDILTTLSLDKIIEDNQEELSLMANNGNWFVHNYNENISALSSNSNFILTPFDENLQNRIVDGTKIRFIAKNFNDNGSKQEMFPTSIEDNGHQTRTYYYSGNLISTSDTEKFYIDSTNFFYLGNSFRTANNTFNNKVGTCNINFDFTSVTPIIEYINKIIIYKDVTITGGCPDIVKVTLKFIDSNTLQISNFVFNFNSIEFIENKAELIINRSKIDGKYIKEINIEINGIKDEVTTFCSIEKLEIMQDINLDEIINCSNLTANSNISNNAEFIKRDFPASNLISDNNYWYSDYKQNAEEYIIIRNNSEGLHSSNTITFITDNSYKPKNVSVYDNTDEYNPILLFEGDVVYNGTQGTIVFLTDKPVFTSEEALSDEFKYDNLKIVFNTFNGTPNSNGNFGFYRLRLNAVWLNDETSLESLTIYTSGYTFVASSSWNYSFLNYSNINNIITDNINLWCSDCGIVNVETEAQLSTPIISFTSESKFDTILLRIPQTFNQGTPNKIQIKYYYNETIYDSEIIENIVFDNNTTTFKVNYKPNCIKISIGFIEFSNINSIGALTLQYLQIFNDNEPIYINILPDYNDDNSTISNDKLTFVNDDGNLTTSSLKEEEVICSAEQLLSDTYSYLSFDNPFYNSNNPIITLNYDETYIDSIKLIYGDSTPKSVRIKGYYNNTQKYSYDIQLPNISRQYLINISSEIINGEILSSIKTNKIELEFLTYYNLNDDNLFDLSKIQLYSMNEENFSITLQDSIINPQIIIGGFPVIYAQSKSAIQRKTINEDEYIELTYLEKYSCWLLEKISKSNDYYVSEDNIFRQYYHNKKYYVDYAKLIYENQSTVEEEGRKIRYFLDTKISTIHAFSINDMIYPITDKSLQPLVYPELKGIIEATLVKGNYNDYHYTTPFDSTLVREKNNNYNSTTTSLTNTFDNFTEYFWFANRYLICYFGNAKIIFDIFYQKFINIRNPTNIDTQSYYAYEEEINGVEIDKIHQQLIVFNNSQTTPSITFTDNGVKYINNENVAKGIWRANNETNFTQGIHKCKFSRESLSKIEYSNTIDYVNNNRVLLNIYETNNYYEVINGYQATYYSRNSLTLYTDNFENIFRFTLPPTGSTLKINFKFYIINTAYLNDNINLVENNLNVLSLMELSVDSEGNITDNRIVGSTLIINQKYASDVVFRENLFIITTYGSPQGAIKTLIRYNTKGISNGEIRICPYIESGFLAPVTNSRKYISFIFDNDFMSSTIE